jgi:small subunit ribosomal protein S6
MRNYEGVFIFSPQVVEETRNQVIDKLKGVIESAGTITTLDDWGSRKLAYEINDFKEGYYTLINFEAETGVISELERICKITDGVIRNMIIKLEK